MTFRALAAQLEFLAWRDDQMSAISQQLEEAFPALRDRLAAEVERAGIVNLVRSSLSLKTAVGEIIRDWGHEQMDLALGRAEAELDQAILVLAGLVNLDSDSREMAMKALPAVAGIGLIGASLAAIPTVISFATVSSTFLAFWSTSAISWPLFAIGAAGIGIAALTGSQALRHAESKARQKLGQRLHREVEAQVFGIGRPLGERSILSDIQASVVQAGRNRIQGAEK